MRISNLNIKLFFFSCYSSTTNAYYSQRVNNEIRTCVTKRKKILGMMLQKPWDGNRVKYILMQLQCSKWQGTGWSWIIKQQQQQLMVASGFWGILSSDLTSSSSSLRCNWATNFNHNTQRIFTEGSIFPPEVRLCLGDTSLCFCV